MRSASGALFFPLAAIDWLERAFEARIKVQDDRGAIYLDDARAHCERARKAGATIWWFMERLRTGSFR
jgi:uncharacterized glyoxalase superfamily protein PhnB